MKYQKDSSKEEQCPYRLSVRSTAFHAVEPGSIPGRDAKFSFWEEGFDSPTVYQTIPE